MRERKTFPRQFHPILEEWGYFSSKQIPWDYTWLEKGQIRGFSSNRNKCLSLFKRYHKLEIRVPQCNNVSPAIWHQYGLNSVSWKNSSLIRCSVGIDEWFFTLFNNMVLEQIKVISSWFQLLFFLQLWLFHFFTWTSKFLICRFQRRWRWRNVFETLKMGWYLCVYMLNIYRCPLIYDLSEINFISLLLDFVLLAWE